MATGRKPDLEIFVTREDRMGNKFYTRVGSAWNVDKGCLSITLEALPVNGKLFGAPPKEKEPAATE